MDLSATSKTSSEFVAGPPSDQRVIDIFAGDWSSTVPGLERTGHADLFRDPRMQWANDILKFRGRSVLELGPLEGAHTKMLIDMGVTKVVAIEGNRRAFLKCLCIKELFDLSAAKFLLGDFNDYLRDGSAKFDAIVASGILYHLSDPMQHLRDIVRRTDRVMLWTHFFEDGPLRSRDDFHLFSPLVSLDAAKHYKGSRKNYSAEALQWSGFSGGRDNHATWLTKQTLIDFFADAGFETHIAFEDVAHVNGPSLALCAIRHPS